MTAPTTAAAGTSATPAVTSAPATSAAATSPASTASAAPADKDLVQAAIRLGWVVAEVRGRNRPDGPAGQMVALPPPLDNPQPLPLAVERTPTELRVQAQIVLQVLTTKLGVDVDPGHASYGRSVDAAAQALWVARRAEPPDPDRVTRAWAELAGVLWDLDAHVQDRLTAVSGTQASGYQLGRGLAECYWALMPTATEGWETWEFLFSSRRATELTRMAGRLAAYLPALSGPAITGSLAAWRLLAGDPRWRAEAGVSEALYAQIRIWFGLVILNEDPTGLIKPYALLRNWRVVLKAARSFGAQLFLAAAGTGALFALIPVLSAKQPPAWLELVLGLLGTFGLSAAGLTTKLKNEAQTLSTRLRQDAYTDLVAVSITTVPDPPHRGHGRNRRAVVERTVADRTLTSATPLR